MYVTHSFSLFICIFLSSKAIFFKFINWQLVITILPHFIFFISNILVINENGTYIEQPKNVEASSKKLLRHLKSR